MKTKTFRNAKYLKWLRSQPCCITGSSGLCEAAHVRMGNGGGMGLKPSDYRAVPLLPAQHRRQHQIGERSFWEENSKDPDIEIIGHLCRFLGNPKDVIQALEEFIERRRESSN